MNILVTAIGSMSAKGVIINLRQSGHFVIGCDINPSGWLQTSCYIKRFYQAPRIADKKAYLQFLLQCCENENLNIILPLTDPEVELLSLHRELFPPDIILAIPPQQVVQVARDKLLWYQAFCHHGYVKPIPTFPLEQYPPDLWQYPLFMKPRKGRSSEGTLRINCNRELKMWQETRAEKNFIVQPWLQGKVYVVDIVRHAQTQQCVSIAREELLRTSNGAGLTVKITNHAGLNELALCIAETLSLNGCINIEFLYTGKAFYLMDINPRFSAGIEFSQMAGYNMVLNHLRCFTGISLSSAITPRTKIFTRHYVSSELIAGECHE